MKKQTRSLIAAAAVLAVLGGALLALSGREETDETGLEIAGLADFPATGMRITNEAGTLEFNKTDGTWTCADDPACPVDSERVQALVESLTALTASRALETPDADADYGLDDPDYVVTLSDEDGALALRASLADAATYVKSSAGDTVYVLTTALPEALDNVLTEWVAYDTPPYATESEIQSITWDGTTVARVPEPADGTDTDSGSDGETEAPEQWTVTADGASRTVERSETITALLDSVRDLYVTGCAGYGAADDTARAAYGLDNAGAHQLRVTYGTEETQTYALRIGSAHADGYYAMLDDNGIVLTLDADAVETLLALHLDA